MSELVVTTSQSLDLGRGIGSNCRTIDLERERSVRIGVVVITLIVQGLRSDVKAQQSLAASSIRVRMRDIDSTRRILGIKPKSICTTTGPDDTAITIGTKLGMLSSSPGVICVKVSDLEQINARVLEDRPV